MLCERPEPFRTRAPLSRTGLLRLTAARLSCRTAPRTHDTRDYLRAGVAAPATTLPLNVLFFSDPAAAAATAAGVCAGAAVASEQEHKNYKDDDPQCIVTEKIAKTVHF